MNPRLKIVLSVVFVLTVAALVARGCMHQKQTPPKPKPVVTKPAPKPAPKPKPKTRPAPAVRAGAPRMAIILDDWGNDVLLVKDAVEIGRPLTLAILPHLKYSKQIAKEASGRGLGIMLHLPMQPEGRRDLEPDTILTTTPDAEILRIVDAALASVPGVKGVNNHMGSAATSDARVMKTLLGHLAKKNLFFVDSYTISTTTGLKTAAAAGVAFARRDVFIDNEPDLELIKDELRRGVRIALAKGSCVLIGHDKKLTLRAIREMVPEIDEAGVRLVLAKELTEKK